MLTAIKLFTVALHLTVNTYHYETPSQFVEMFGHATNEIICKEEPIENRKNLVACRSFCFSATEWFSDDDIEEIVGSVCQDIGITRYNQNKEDYEEKYSYALSYIAEKTEGRIDKEALSHIDGDLKEQLGIAQENSTYWNKK